VRIDEGATRADRIDHEQDRRIHFQSPAEEIRIELTRKSLHLLIIICIPLLDISPTVPIVALLIGMLVYSTSEWLRHKGVIVPIIAPITEHAARRRDGNRFVIGPITLALGALLAIIIFDPLQAKVAILALAIGDSFSSLIGKSCGRIPMPLSGGKSFEGSVFCFLTVLVAVFIFTGKFIPALIIAAATASVEFWPTKDWDNVLIPLAAGIIASIVL
jgi:dolichol kinase